jgi:hypothetical protein
VAQDPVNQSIIDMESAPYPDMDAATYINQDIWLQFLQGKIDLKMIQCVYWSRQSEYDATPEELYSISPDYINGRKMCYGMGRNRVTTNELYLPSPDHLIPRTKGGSYKIDNLVIVPLKYNIWKRDILKEDWQAFKKFMDDHLAD